MKRVYYLGVAALLLVILWVLFPYEENKRVYEPFYQEDAVASSAVAESRLSGWQQNGNAWFYYDPATGKVKKGWLEIGSKWYYLDTKTGVMKTGWQKIGKFWYYFEPDNGRMKTGWLCSGKNWYYFAPETGRMTTGWKQVGKFWYYFDLTTGRMKTGWLAVGKNWFYLEPETGRMKTGWLEHRGKWYYFADDGRMHVGWIDWKGKKYLFKESGEMAAGEVAIYDGKKYAFSGKGDWLGEKRASFLEAYAKAATYVKKYTDDSMTDIQKLRVCYDLFATFTEKNPWIPHYKGDDWVEVYANDCLDTRVSNCLGFGASLGLMARVIGFDDVYCCNSGGHGWVEIANLVYDPEWTLHHEGNFFGRPIVRGEKQDYSVAVNRSKEYWGYVRI